MKPIIGINLDIENQPVSHAQIRMEYIQAILSSGGIPWLLPPMPDEDLKIILPNLNGLVLIGGNDYSPELYGEEKSPTIDLIDPLRQDFDLRLIKLALKRSELPILGICGGCQLLNIALGGSLIQDIETEYPQSTIVHGNAAGCSNGTVKHSVSINPNSLLAKFCENTQLEVSTSHHQSVKHLGKGLVSTAFTEDGIIEAIELSDRPFVIGVQWHPERNCLNCKQLFQNFIKQSALLLPSKGSFCEPAPGR